MANIGTRLKKGGAKGLRTGTVWKGPESPDSQGGITFSLLCRYLTCRERFRLLTMEGLKSGDKFEVRMEYGNMWHVCEEALAANRDWERDLTVYVKELLNRYRFQQPEIDKWYNVCKVQFPIYVKYWSENDDVTARTPLMQEYAFRIPYQLGSGRTVYLRGKFDAVDLIGADSPGIYLQENKTKSEIVDGDISRQLTFDLQTMLYLTALTEGALGEGVQQDWPDEFNDRPIAGVRYNVIRRPLSGGKGTIVQHKPTKSNPAGETKEHYFDRLKGIIEESPKEFFARWKVEVSPAEVERFRRECLDPMLEELCDWWDWVKVGDPWRAGNRLHFRYPYGVFNPLLEGYATDLDNFLDSGSDVGLRRVTELFTELG